MNRMTTMLQAEYLTERLFDDEGELSRRLADDIATRLREAIAARGQAVLAVSGGRSPIPLFVALRAKELAWEHVTVLLIDERVVPHDHADSNTRLVREHLLRENAASATMLTFFNALPVTAAAPSVTEPAKVTSTITSTITAAAPEAPAALAMLAAQAARRLAALPPIDVAVLGMGVDGHTASLFSQAAGIEAALDPESAQPCAAVVPPHAPHARITLTLAALLRARHLVLQISGPAKRAVYARALQAPQSGRPVSLVLNQRRVPVDVWIGA